MLNSQVLKFTDISKNKVLASSSEFTVPSLIFPLIYLPSHFHWFTIHTLPLV